MGTVIEAATFLVARYVQRENNLRCELSALLKHCVNGWHIDVCMLWNLFQLVDHIENFVHHKLHVSQRWVVSGHADYSC